MGTTGTSNTGPSTTGISTGGQNSGGGGGLSSGGLAAIIIVILLILLIVGAIFFVLFLKNKKPELYEKMLSTLSFTEKAESTLWSKIWMIRFEIDLKIIVFVFLDLSNG